MTLVDGIQPVFCKLGNKKCGYCSNEYDRTTERVPDLKQHKMIITVKETSLGQRCNNACAWTRDIKECPIPAALEVCRKVITENKPLEADPLNWMRKREAV